MRLHEPMLEEGGAIDRSVFVSVSESPEDKGLKKYLCASAIRLDLRLAAVSRGQAIESEY